MRTEARPTPADAWRRRGAWVSIVGFWLLYFVVNTVRNFAFGHPHQLEMSFRRALVIVLMMAVSWGLHLALRRGAGSLPRSVALASAVALPAALTYATLNALVFAAPGLGRPSVWSWRCPHPLTEAAPAAGGGMALGQMSCGEGALRHDIIGTTADGYFLFIAWSAIYLALGYAGEVRALERRAAELRAAAQSAELRALRYQVNPHFLFNTLNSLSSLVVTGRTQAAERMIENLSTFFRTSLSGDPTHDVTLAEEVELQRLYLKIEAVRFPERLRTAVFLPPELEAARVPGLILQPLVENAVKHGVSATAHPVTVVLRAEAVAGRLRLRVEDDAAARERSGAEAESSGVGLRNVCDRLTARYGDAAGCCWERPPAGGFVAEISLPLSRHAG